MTFTERLFLPDETLLRRPLHHESSSFILILLMSGFRLLLLDSLGRVQLADGDAQLLEAVHQSVHVVVVGAAQLEVQLGQTLLLIPQTLHLLHAAAAPEGPKTPRVEIVHEL